MPEHCHASTATPTPVAPRAMVTVRLTAITRLRNHTRRAARGVSCGWSPGTGRIRGATLIRVNGNNTNHSARDGDPEVKPPHE